MYVIIIIIVARRCSCEHHINGKLNATNWMRYGKNQMHLNASFVIVPSVNELALVQVRQQIAETRCLTRMLELCIQVHKRHTHCTLVHVWMEGWMVRHSVIVHVGVIYAKIHAQTQNTNIAKIECDTEKRNIVLSKQIQRTEYIAKVAEFSSECLVRRPKKSSLYIVHNLPEVNPRKPGRVSPRTPKCSRSYTLSPFIYWHSSSCCCYGPAHPPHGAGAEAHMCVSAFLRVCVCVYVVCCVCV